MMQNSIFIYSYLFRWDQLHSGLKRGIIVMIHEYVKVKLHRRFQKANHHPFHCRISCFSSFLSMILNILIPDFLFLSSRRGPAKVNRIIRKLEIFSFWFVGIKQKLGSKKSSRKKNPLRVYNKCYDRCFPSGACNFYSRPFKNRISSINYLPPPSPTLFLYQMF